MSAARSVPFASVLCLLLPACAQEPPSEPKPVAVTTAPAKLTAQPRPPSRPAIPQVPWQEPLPPGTTADDPTPAPLTVPAPTYPQPQQPAPPINTYRAPAQPYAPPSVPPADGGSSEKVQVKGYYRKDGTYVKPHTRSKPKR